VVVFNTRGMLGFVESRILRAILVSLTFVLWPRIYLSSLDFKSFGLNFTYTLLLLVVVASFLVKSLLGFYILFELRVVPISIVIIG